MLMAYEEELDAIDITGEVTLFDARLGGFQTLAKLLTSAIQRRKKQRKIKDVGQQRLNNEKLATSSCLLALQARLLHEYRYLIAGVQQSHDLVKSSAVLRALTAAFFRAVTGEPHDDATEQCTRDAALYAVTLSSAVFLPTVLGGGDTAQRPPACRALVGRQLVETLWLERLAEAITHHAAGMQPTETLRMRLALSILAHGSYDSRPARQALLQCPGLLPYLLRGVCKAKGVDTDVRLWSLCVLSNCTSTDPCLDDDTQQPAAQQQQEVAGMVGPALEVLIQHCGLVPYLYGLLITSLQEWHGGGEHDRTRAAVVLCCECLVHCLAHCPASTLAALHERGALLSFPALLCPPPTAPHDGPYPSVSVSVAKAQVHVQRFGVAMLSAMLDLYTYSKRHEDKDRDGTQAGAGAGAGLGSSSQGLRRQGSGAGRRGSQSSTSKPSEGDKKGGKRGGLSASASGSGKLSVLSKDTSFATKVPLSPPPPPPLAPPEFVSLLAASGGLVPMAWLLQHRDHKVQSHVRRVWRFLLRSGGDGSLAALWVESFIEQGGVPILFLGSQRRPGASRRAAEGRTVRMAEGVEGGEGESAALARQVLQALQAMVQQPDLLSRLVCRTTSVTLAPRQRGHIATALLLLSCGAPRVREAFVRNGGLHCILNMMHNPTTRDAAVSFLMAVDSLVEQEHRPQCWQTYVEDEAGDLLFEEPPLASTDTPPPHRQAGDVVIHIQTIELSRRKTVIEMACPPSHVIKQASPVLQGLLEEAEATGTRATVQGSYKVWEEIMSHIAQPSCFGRARARYSPELLVDMMHTAHRYGLWELKTVYGVRLSSSLDESSAVTLLHAALQAQHSWLALEAYRVLLASVDYVCSRSARALPLAVQLMEELLTCLLLG